MKRPIVVLAALFSMTAGPAAATDIYKCGNTYTDTPCGKRIVLPDTRPTEADHIAVITRYYESKLYLQAREYDRREFELTKAYIQSPRITQTTTVTATSGSSSSAGASASVPITHLKQIMYEPSN